MQFRILGPVEADGPDGPVPLGGPRHRVLLVTMLMTPGHVVPTERLVEATWGEDAPRRALEMVHVRISELRRFLPTLDVIVTRRPGYLVDVAASDVDAQRFDSAATEARRLLADGDPTLALERLDAALALWKGSPLPEIAGRDCARAYVTRLGNLHVQAVEDRITACLAVGRHRDVLTELDALVREHPLHERYREQLMLALYRDGRQSAALEVYRQGAETLREELGIDPGHGMQHLRLHLLFL